MKLVEFRSLIGMQDADCSDLGEYRKWANGEKKQLPDDVAAIALTNPNFIEVEETFEHKSSAHHEEEV
jgi:hypothetical protein